MCLIDFVFYIKTAIKSKQTVSMTVDHYHIAFPLGSAMSHLKEKANWKDWFKYLLNCLSE